jgi:hypothetical protein
MLFDLRGRRRRTVQATYLTLAILMGGGLVFFGIGSDVSGGLADIFGERGGGSDAGNEVIEERIDRNEKRAQQNPRDRAALGALVRDYYGLATANTPSGATGFPKDARDELAKAAGAWQRYLNAVKEPDPSIANYALQVYDVPALNKPAEAQRAASIVAEAENEPTAYIRLVQYAALAKDTRTADLAGKKAIDLASKADRKAVAAQVQQAKALAAQAEAQGGAQPQGG